MSLAQTLKFYSKVLRPKAATEEVVRVEKEENYGELFKTYAIGSRAKKTKTPASFWKLFLAPECFIKLRTSIWSRRSIFLNCASAWTAFCRICCI